MYNRSNTYQEIAVQTSSPAKLVVMLYEGAIRFLRQSLSVATTRHLIDGTARPKADRHFPRRSQ